MKSLILKQAERFLREQKNYKRWLAVFLCLAVVVVIGTTAALKYKGIAVTTDNEEVHVHTDACYEEKEVLICDAAKSSEGGHVHDDSCYSSGEGGEELTCGKEEHEHGDGCYTTETETVTETDEEGNETTVENEKEVLSCDKEEHTHDSGCYGGGERELVCGLEEGEGAAESDHVHDESCYRIEKVLICGEETGEKEEEPVEEDVSGNDVEEELLEEDISGNDLEEGIIKQECKNDDLNIIVIAEYGPEAEIPKDAKLKVEQITREDDPDYYEEREAEYLQEAGEDAVMDMLLDIGFYVGGTEIEPKAPVTITIQMLDDNYDDGEEINVVHFGKEETEKLDASEIETNEDGNKATSFETNSFSTFAIGTSGISASALNNGEEYLIYCSNGGQTVALSHKNDKLEAVSVTISNGKLVQTPDGYERDDFFWTYEYYKGVDYGIEVESRALKYGDSKKHYLDRNVDEWRISPDYANINLEFASSGSNITIGSEDTSGNKRYLNYSGSGITAATSNPTNWTFVPPEKKYTVNFYKNEASVKAFQQSVTNKGTLIGKKEISAEVASDGKTVLRIPLYGNTDAIDGLTPADIGQLEDYVTGGITYKFYGWSKSTQANYMWDKGYEIYCGESFTINGVTVPTYIEGGTLVLEASENETNIDLYAIWAAPTDSNGKTGITYYGAGKEERGSKNGVMFYIRLDGNIPNEPGSGTDLNSVNYTDGVRAKNRTDKGFEVVENPLNYWMHIYGSGNAAAVKANLWCEPTAEDIYDVVLRAITTQTQTPTQTQGKKVYVGGEEITTENIGSREDFGQEYYVAWYVSKDRQVNPTNDDYWHIDGVLMKKSLWTLVYVAEDVVDPDSVIPGKQYKYKDGNGSATIHNTIDTTDYSQSNTPPVRTGYKFIGWNTEKDGSGTSFSAEDQVTVDRNGQVYIWENENWTPVEGLHAEESTAGSNHTLTLYAQWANGTNLLKVAKTDENKTALRGAKFSLYRCELENGTLKEGECLTREGGNATSINGILEIKNLENNTYYRLDESYAPNGYEKRNSIYFTVEVSEDKEKVMDVSIVGINGEPISAPDWLTAVYKGDNTGSDGVASINFTIEDEAILQDVSFVKVDENDRPMEGAKFTLSRKVGNGYQGVGTSSASDKDGKFTFENLSKLAYGEYKLEETTAPTGYKKTTVYFTINDPDSGHSGMFVTGVEIDGKTVENSAGYCQVGSTAEKTEISHGTDNIPARRYSYTLTVKNERSIQSLTLALKKYDAENPSTLLGGAEFNLYNGTDGVRNAIKEGTISESQAEKTITSDENGMGQIGDLDEGTYYLIEKTAPGGYDLLTKPIEIQISKDGVKAYRGLNETGNVDSIPIEESKDNETGKITYIIPVSNSKGIELPQTGGPGTEAYTFGGLAVIAVSLMYGLGMRRKRRKGGLN